MQDNKSLLFSRFHSQELQQVGQLLSSVFETSVKELAVLYQQLGNDFDKDGWPSHFVSRGFFRSVDDDFHETYKKSPSIAVDLPSCLERDDGNSCKPTVVILGQDPKGNEDHEDTSLGTPYGMHHQGSREELTRTKLYFDMMQAVMDLGYRVYLTDVFKIWVCNPQNRYSGISLPKADKKRFSDILEAELSAIKPAAVVTWGKPSEKAVRDLAISKHLIFPHPSGAANGAWKKLMNKSPTNENKLDYWKSSMRNALSCK